MSVLIFGTFPIIAGMVRHNLPVFLFSVPIGSYFLIYIGISVLGVYDKFPASVLLNHLEANVVKFQYFQQHG